MSHISNDDPNKQNESMFDKPKKKQQYYFCLCKLSLKDKKKKIDQQLSNCQVELGPSKVPILKKRFS